MLIERHSFDVSETSSSNDSFGRGLLPVKSETLQIDVGLVNNMPDGALKQTERQFRHLLELGSGEGLCVRMHFLSMAGVPRGEEALADMRGRYVNVEHASCLPLDALIVTGAEPRAKSLCDETYWPQFAKLMDWAARNTVSTICSCLAAHAAVLHFDRIERRAIGFKRSGVFESEAEGDHPLLRDLASRVAIPHSRYNEVREDDLRGAGYRILTRSQRAGADMFINTRGKCAFLFFQGHPEYERCTLLREYRRDVLRYLNGERDEYPIMPFNYFEPEMESRLARLETRAKQRRSVELASELPLPSEEEKSGICAPIWAASAVAIYRNWLNHIVEAKRRASVDQSLILSRRF